MTKKNRLLRKQRRADKRITKAHANCCKSHNHKWYDPCPDMSSALRQPPSKLSRLLLKCADKRKDKAAAFGDTNPYDCKFLLDWGKQWTRQNLKQYIESLTPEHFFLVNTSNHRPNTMHTINQFK
jgi:hypothetical protein